MLRGVGSPQLHPVSAGLVAPADFPPCRRYPLKRPSGQFLVPKRQYLQALHSEWTAGETVRSLIPNQRGKDAKKYGKVAGTVRSSVQGVLPWQSLLVAWDDKGDKTPPVSRVNPWEVGRTWQQHAADWGRHARGPRLWGSLSHVCAGVRRAIVHMCVLTAVRVAMGRTRGRRSERW